MLNNNDYSTPFPFNNYPLPAVNPTILLRTDFPPSRPATTAIAAIAPEIATAFASSSIFADSSFVDRTRLT